MFWGLNLKPNRKYTQTSAKAFHISQAALEVEGIPNGASSQVFINCENQKFLICTLHKGSCEQVMLDLNFAEGDEICFQTVGNGQVTLSGYVVEDEVNPYMLGDEEESESDVADELDLRNKLKAKGKKGEAEKAAGKSNSKPAPADDDDDDDDDSDFDDGAAELDGDDDSDGEEEADDDDEEEDDDEDDEEDDSADEEVSQPQSKKSKLEEPHKKQNGVAKEATAEKKGKKNKKDKKDNQQPQQQQQPQQKAGGERSLTGGVKIEDIRVGNGAEVKAGKRAQVYYEGRLKSNNKVFDSLKTGAGFKFNVGRGDVIKAWDVGVVGMKVGGKRRIICPPHMAYGSRGSPPTIPPNSTLVFEVELKGTN